MSNRPPGWTPWDRPNAVRIGALAGALLGAGVSAVVRSQVLVLVFGGAILGIVIALLVSSTDDDDE